MVKPKTNALAAALDSATEIPEKTPARKKPIVKPARPLAKTRTGTALIAGHFTKETKKQMRILAAEEETTSQELLAQALELLFKKKGVRVGEIRPHSE